MNDTLIMIATYNEAENISRLVDEIIAEANNSDLLIIDDNSPDGTSVIVEKLRRQNPRVNMIRRSAKLGYGSAYKEGFDWALKRGKHDYILTMDADFSHNPKYICQFFEKIKKNDIVIGSRYVRGGGIKNWGIHRRVLSRAANVYSKLILNMPANDCTSGFRCYNRYVIEKVDFGTITSEGYCFLEELLFNCYVLGMSIAEVPIIFEDRKYGKSKISKKEIFRAILKIPRLKLAFWARRNFGTSKFSKRG